MRPETLMPQGISRKHAGSARGRFFPRTEEARGSNPLTSTIEKPLLSARLTESPGSDQIWATLRLSRWAAWQRGWSPATKMVSASPIASAPAR